MNFPYRITIDQLENYMKQGVKNFVAKESLTLQDQSKRIQLCDKYFYYSFTCYDPTEFEYSKMPDNIIRRIGALSVIMNLFNNKVISAKQAKELSEKVDEIKDEFNTCTIYNQAIKEIV